jgi:hypothetical protein
MITPAKVIDAIYSYMGDEHDAPKAAAVEVVRPNWKLFAHGSDHWRSTLPVAQSYIVAAGDRVEALLAAKKSGVEWIIWLEEGNRLVPDWEYNARVLTKPGIRGRVNRTKDGQHYPYPGGFAVHASLLKEGVSFVDLFSEIDPTTYGSIDDLVVLSTRPARLT